MRKANRKEYQEILKAKAFYQARFEKECHTLDEVAFLLDRLVHEGSSHMTHVGHVAALTVLVAGSFRDYGRFGVQFNMPATSECCRMYKYLEDALKKRKPITLACYGGVMLDDVCYWPEKEGDGILLDQDGNVHEWRIA